MDLEKCIEFFSLTAMHDRQRLFGFIFFPFLNEKNQSDSKKCTFKYLQLHLCAPNEIRRIIEFYNEWSDNDIGSSSNESFISMNEGSNGLTSSFKIDDMMKKSNENDDSTMPNLVRLLLHSFKMPLFPITSFKTNMGERGLLENKKQRQSNSFRGETDKRNENKRKNGNNDKVRN